MLVIIITSIIMTKNLFCSKCLIFFLEIGVKDCSLIKAENLDIDFIPKYMIYEKSPV